MVRMTLFILRGMNTVLREGTHSEQFCLPSEKQSTLKGKNLLCLKFSAFFLSMNRFDDFLHRGD